MIYAFVTLRSAHLFPSQCNAKWAFFFRETIYYFDIKSNEGKFSIRCNGRCIRNSRFDTCANDLQCFHCYRLGYLVQILRKPFSIFCSKVGQFCGRKNILGNQLWASSPTSYVSCTLIESIMDYIKWEDLVLALVLVYAHGE